MKYICHHLLRSVSIVTKIVTKYDCKNLFDYLSFEKKKNIFYETGIHIFALLTVVARLYVAAFIEHEH